MKKEKKNKAASILGKLSRKKLFKRLGIDTPEKISEYMRGVRKGNQVDNSRK